MGWVGCVLGLCTRGSHLKRRGGGGWKEVGRSEERGMWAKENWGLVFVAVQLWDENHYQQQKKTERSVVAG